MIATYQQPAHAKSRPPSGAERWVNCHGSVTVVPLYPNSTSVQSLKGEEVHKHIENGIIFGILPDTHDPDADMNVRDVLEWVVKTAEDYRLSGDHGLKIYAEQRYDIPETGEFGTCDITFVGESILHLADYKNGYVSTNAYEQMMTYLLGAVAKFGPREIMKVTVLQPNYDHIDGAYRTRDVTLAEFSAWRGRVEAAVAGDTFKAGKWCKKTYCPHRGACKTFLDWCETTGEDAWYPHEINSFDDERLAKALDHAEVLQGVRDELRKEAMRRILNHSRTIAGYKIVKSRTNREFAGEAGREACYTKLIELGYSLDQLYEEKPFKVGNLTLHERTQLGVAGVERMVKQKYKKFKRGTWSQVWDEHFAPHIRSFSGSLTLERAIDGRPAHTRGSEFGQLTPALGSSLQVI